MAGVLRARAWWLALCVALVIAAPSRAFAWVEMHVARDDVRLTVDADGSARVEHKILLLVSGGPLKSFVIRGVDPDASVEMGAYVVAEKDDKAGSVEDALPLTARRMVDDDPAGRADLQVEIDGSRGISRGRYVAVVRYRTNLLERGLLKIDGASAHLDWVGPSWEDGLETTRAWFQFRSAPLEPKTRDTEDDADGNAPAQGTFLSSVARKPDLDVLEVVRPYAARGERVVWSLRLDARVVDAGVRTGAPAARERNSGAPQRSDVRPPLRLVSNTKDTFVLLGALSLFVLIAALVAAHAIEVRQRCARREQKPRPLIPMPIALRAILAGALFVTGIWLELHQPSSLPGALAVAACAPLIWHRATTFKPSLRGPGAWLCIRLDEALAGARPRPRGVFEATSVPGAIMLVLLVAGFAGAAELVAERSVYHGVLIALDVVPLLTLFVTGRTSSFVPDAAVDPIPLLAKVARHVEARSRQPVRVIPRIRVPQGSPDPDEIRLVFLPQAPVRGLRAVEVAVAHGAGPGGYVALPEVLLRFDEGTACDAVVQSLENFGRVQRGRRLEERVVAFVPRLPTAAMTAELVLAILDRTGAASCATSSKHAAPARQAPARRSIRPATESAKSA